MLQKIENLYLAILRLVVISAAGILLVAVVVFGVSALGVFQSEPTSQATAPSVPDDAVKKLVLAEAKNDKAAPITAKTAQLPKASDQNQPYFDRIATAVHDFVEQQSDGSMGVDKAKLIKLIRQSADKYDDANLASTYAKNLADSVERLLKDPSTIDAAKHGDPIEVAFMTIDGFATLFNEQIEKTQAENTSRQREYLKKKAEGMESIYFAGGAFGAFLMIVFLSIAIRIERNLRHLESRTVQAG